MTNPFPKYTSSRLTGDKGVTLVTKIIEDQFNWIFRATPQEHDFGIDGYIDIVNSESYVTGKSIAVQIKTGPTYFKKTTSNGWEFHGEIKHLNYYLNHSSPLVLIIVDLEIQQAFWVLFDADKISKSNTGWIINIYKSNTLESKYKDYLHSLPGFEVDYLTQLEYQWNVDNTMKESGIIMVGVDRSEVESLDFSGFNTLLKRLTASDEMINKTRGKLSFVLFGYENDTRELYEIPEVREWAKQIIPAFKYWGYFLALEEPYSKYSGLIVLHLCSVKINVLGPDESNTGNLVEPDEEETLELMQQLFGWLNDFTDKYKISEEINKQLSYKLAYSLTGVDLNNVDLQ
jgi:hypothetical protein